MQGDRPAHPGLGTDGAGPIGEGGDSAQIFAHVLLADPACGNDAAAGESQCCAVDRFEHENALGVMA